ncbi:MAG: DUF309 domain-containing protein [Psychrobacillus sp.]
MHPTFDTKFVHFITEFNETKDYFECHELLEDYWKEVAPRQKVHPLAALILLSTSMYHWRRGNFQGAYKTMKSSIKRMEETIHSPFFETLNTEQLLKDASRAYQSIQLHKPFSAFQIVIQNDSLLILTQEVTLSKEIDQHFLIHKHMLRDRSEILEEREKMKKRRDDQ